MNSSFLCFLLLTVLACNALVTPDVILEKVKKGESVHTVKRVFTPAIPPMIDLVLVQDLTGSFADDLVIVKGDAADCSNGLAAMLYDMLSELTDGLRFGVAGFMDFFVEGTGWANACDLPFILVEELTDDKMTYLSAICSLQASGGGDFEEAQFNALSETATQFSWSEMSDVFRVAVLITDAPSHTPENTPGYPGPSEEETIAILNEQNIHVIVLQAPGAAGYEGIAEGTGGVIKSIEDDSSDIVSAIIEALGELTADLVPVLSDCDPRLTVTFDPPMFSDVSMDTKKIFIETVSVNPRCSAEFDEKLKCTVNFLLDGVSIGEELIFILPEFESDKKDDHRPHRKAHRKH